MALSEKPVRFKKTEVRISTSNAFFSESPYQKTAKILDHLEHSLLIDGVLEEDFTLLYLDFFLNFNFKFFYRKWSHFFPFLSKSHTLKSYFSSFLMLFKNQIIKVQKINSWSIQTLPELGQLGGLRIQK